MKTYMISEEAYNDAMRTTVHCITAEQLLTVLEYETKILMTKELTSQQIYLEINTSGNLIVKIGQTCIAEIDKDTKKFYLSTRTDALETYAKWRKNSEREYSTSMLFWKNTAYTIAEGVLRRKSSMYGHIYDFEKLEACKNNDPNVLTDEYHSKTILF